MLQVQSFECFCFACVLHRYRNQTGVEIRTVDFGGVGGIAALDPALPQVPFLVVLTYKKCFNTSFKVRIRGRQVVLDCRVGLLLVIYNTETTILFNEFARHVHMQPLQSATLCFWVQLTSVYQELIDTLVEVGYEVRRDLFGAPYDWRLAADGLEQVCY